MAGSMRVALLLAAAAACCLAQQLPQTGAAAASAAAAASSDEQALIASLPGYSSYYYSPEGSSSHYDATHNATLHVGSRLSNVVVEQHAEVNVKDLSKHHKTADYDSAYYGEDAYSGDRYASNKAHNKRSKYGGSKYTHPKHKDGDGDDDDAAESQEYSYKGSRKHGKHGSKYSAKYGAKHGDKGDKDSISYPKKHHAGYKGAYAPKASPSPSPAPYAPKPSPSPSPEHPYLYRPEEEEEESYKGEEQQQPPVYRHHGEKEPEHKEPPADSKPHYEEHKPEEYKEEKEEQPKKTPESYAEDTSGYPDLSHRLCIQEFQRDIIPRGDGDTEKCLNVSQTIKFLSHVSCCQRDDIQYFSDEEEYGSGKKHVYDGVSPPPVNIGHCTWTVTPNAHREHGYVTHHAQRQSATVEALCEFTTPAAAECIPFGDFKDGGSVSFRVKNGYWYRSIGAIMAPHGDYAYSHANKHAAYKVEEEPFWFPGAQASGQATVQRVVEGEAPKQEVQGTATPKPAEAAAEAATPKPEAATATPKPAEETKAAAPSDATVVGTAAVNNFFFSDEALQQQPAKHYNKHSEHYNREAEGYNRHSEYYESEGEYGGGYDDHAELEAHRGVGDLFMGHISHVQQHAGDNYHKYGGGYAATAAAANANTRASSSKYDDDFLVGHHGSGAYYGGGGYGSAIKGVGGGIIEFVAGFADEEGAVLYPTDTGCTDWADFASRESEGEVPLLLAGASWIKFDKEAEQYYGGDSHYEAPAYHGKGGYNSPRY